METCPTCDAHLRIDGKVIECSRFPKCSWVMSLHEWATELITEDFGDCPNCKVRAVKKQNKTTEDYFIGCPNFPKCKWSRRASYSVQYNDSDDWDDDKGFYDGFDIRDTF